MELDTKKQLLQLAVENNAAWCDTVCRSHNVPGEFHKTFWVNHHQTPPFYPNLVTLAPVTDLQPRLNGLSDLLIEKQDQVISIKDSFAMQDLKVYGFQQLFQTQWIAREAPIEPLRQDAHILQWRKIVTDEELLQWEQAFSHQAPLADRLFLPTLLHNQDICILAAFQEDQVVAGAIANQTGKVVGISNVFTPELDMDHYWSGLLEQLATRFPGLPIVGYEQDESLSIAIYLGFEMLGPLRVWIK